MRPRGTDAIPLPPRPNLEQYRKRAKGLVKACKTGDRDTVRAWAREWLTALAELHGATNTSERDGAAGPRHLEWAQIGREVDRIEKDARESNLLSDAGSGSCTLADSQLFLARLHD